MNKLPHIGIVAMSDTDRTDCEYAIRRAGGLPLVLETSNSQTGIDLVNKLKGVLVAISPESFPFVIELISTCLERDLPILAIGEGCLSLNRAIGGSSIDAANHINIDKEDIDPVFHRIYITPGSKLAATVGSGGFVRVNSFHKHCITEAQKSRKLLASAYAIEDGVIEALESPDHTWVIGVQFSPQRRMELPPHFNRLFEALVFYSSGDKVSELDSSSFSR
tara:strand:- start:5893 stop:6555 length:663 start_codon:yes stop_codon:yes gene_type:complete